MTETTPSPQASEPQIDLLELLGLLWDSRWLIALVAVIGAGFGVLYSMSQTPIYRANSLVQVEPEQSGLLAVSQLSGLSTAGIGVGAELELLKSRTVLSEVVDELGLDELDRKYLKVIGGVYEGGPVGLEAVAATLGEDAGTLEDMVEPYLLQIGFLARTRKGRQLTGRGAAHLGFDLKPQDDREALFD